MRKQMYELELSDFASSPVWEFALDEEPKEGQDEATVRPYSTERELDPSGGMFVVKARFVLADGTLMHGYVTPPFQGDSGLGTLQPIIITPTGQVSFWFGAMTPDPEIIAKEYQRLGKESPTQVFPIQFESLVPLTVGTGRGDIPGFMMYEDFQSKRIRVIK